MTWQETVMSEEQFKAHCRKCTHSCDIYPHICRMEKQTQLTWDKASEAGREDGRKEVLSLLGGG